MYACIICILFSYHFLSVHAFAYKEFTLPFSDDRLIHLLIVDTLH